MTAPFGGFLQALGQAFGGYAQDEQTRVARARQAALDAQAAQMHAAQLANYQSEAEKRAEEIKAAQQKALSNRRAYNALKGQFADHPLAGGEYDDATDYGDALKAAQGDAKTRKSFVDRQRADYNTLKLEFGKDPLALAPFDETNPANYSAALQAARERAAQAAIVARQQPRFHNFVDAQGGMHFVTEEEGARQGWTLAGTQGRGGESPQIQSTRKDLRDTQGQQIRAEHDVTATKSDIRNLLRDHPRASQPLPIQRTASDSAFANQYTTANADLAGFEKRKKDLTARADSIQGALSQQRAGTVPATTGAPPVAQPNNGNRAQLERQGFQEVMARIDREIKDPAQRLAKKREATAIFSARMQKLQAGLDPDTP